MTDISGIAGARQGVTSNSVPFVAFPPERTARGVILLWHGADPPRTEEALAAAVPMKSVPAWRLYLGMPGHGRRSPEGGVEEIMRLAGEDALTLLFRPRIEGALSELPEAVHDIRNQLDLDAALPLGIFGFSQGGSAALLAVSRRILPFKAAVTFGAVVDFVLFMNAMADYFGMTYEWTDERRALAAHLSAAGRARTLAENGAAILFGVGAEDPNPTLEPAERLVKEIRNEGGKAELRILPSVAHAFVDEPGEAAAPQRPQAHAVDELASAWFNQYFV